jgi:hypothetical protein
VAAVRARWSSSAFLLYAGGLTVLAATGGLLGALSNDYGHAAFVGWSALVLAGLSLLAAALRARGEAVAAGLFAVSAVVAFGVLVGSIESWLGWLAEENSPFGGFHPGNLVLGLVIVAAALVSLRLFRFPLLVLVAAAVSWFFVTDLLSNGGDLAAAVTVGYGVVLMVLAFAVDPVYGFWLHVVAGVTIGGGLLFYWHSNDTDWVLVAIAALVFVVLASRFRRSSYAVLGAIGLFLTTTHFVEKWFGFPLFPFFAGAGDEAWGQAISYGVLGLALMLLGLWLARDERRPAPG